MTLTLRTRTATAITVLAALYLLFVATVPALAQQADARGRGDGRGPGRGFGGFIQSNDPRVQNRTYRFADTNEDLPYCVFVSSKVSKDKKAPLIVSLHGLGVGPGIMCRGKAIDLAEEGGYIYVARHPRPHHRGGHARHLRVLQGSQEVGRSTPAAATAEPAIRPGGRA